MSAEVDIKTTPSIVAAAHRTETSYPGIFEDIPAGFQMVMDFLNEVGIDPAGVPVTVYYQVTDADTPGVIAICVPVAAPIPTNDRTQMPHEPGRDLPGSFRRPLHL